MGLVAILPVAERLGTPVAEDIHRSRPLVDVVDDFLSGHYHPLLPFSDPWYC